MSKIRLLIIIIVFIMIILTIFTSCSNAVVGSGPEWKGEMNNIFSRFNDVKIERAQF